MATVTASKKANKSAKDKSSGRGRTQDRSKVAGGQEYEVNYEKKKTGKSTGTVKAAVRAVGNSRKKVEKRFKVK
jgi:hypothetical protein